MTFLSGPEDLSQNWRKRQGHTGRDSTVILSFVIGVFLSSELPPFSFTPTLTSRLVSDVDTPVKLNVSRYTVHLSRSLSLRGHLARTRWDFSKPPHYISTRTYTYEHTHTRTQTRIHTHVTLFVPIYFSGDVQHHRYPVGGRLLLWTRTLSRRPRRKED